MSSSDSDPDSDMDDPDEVKSFAILKILSYFKICHSLTNDLAIIVSTLKCISKSIFMTIDKKLPLAMHLKERI